MSPEILSIMPTLDDYEAEHIKDRIELCAGNLSNVAESLGITRTTLRSKCRKYGIPTPRSMK